MLMRRRRKKGLEWHSTLGLEYRSHEHRGDKNGDSLDINPKGFARSI